MVDGKSPGMERAKSAKQVGKATFVNKGADT